MKLRRIAESDYEGLEDADEFVNIHEIYDVPEPLVDFIHAGSVSGDLTPVTNPEQSYLEDIKGFGRYVFPIQTEYREDVDNLFQNIDTDWASEFQWELRAAIINAVLAKAGLDVDMDCDWRMMLRVIQSGFDKSDPLVWVEFRFR